ncbi:MaoC dehydratase-like protein [Branchiibius hedensis]|uniref:MaoC like domain-containing protein n=1 Tax=Branchiibius hedensis TaxID=672460 RepID=A0A2Y8ZVB4_9MICO|nr:MaoC/PaaZ C-terminal domain-containing protein [Branchiibius hedensis]PWJ27064.1 MaoC dehydratase-like protein [Branchiibius hedensis]SSA35875.1 MaoC like domain-containing protein [Branchiibius hedensis]
MTEPRTQTLPRRLPEVRIPVDRTFVVASAMASQDFQDVHHDPDLARERGAPDIFLNILTSTGLVERLVTDWAGPAVTVNRLQIRLGMPCHPGDELVLTGEVSDEDSDQVVVQVRGTHERGVHVSGSVTVALPEGTTLATLNDGRPAIEERSR